MKNLACFAMVAVMALCFVACSGGSNSVANDPALEELVKTQGKSFTDAFESSFSQSSGGMNCNCELKVQGTELVVECRIDNVDNVPAETKAQMQQIYDQQADSLKSGFDVIKQEAPNLSKVTMLVCEEDGDEMAKVELNF